MTAERKLVIGEIKRFAGFAFPLVFRVFCHFCKEIAVCSPKIIKCSFYNALRDVIGPRILLFPDGMELLLERKRVRWHEDTVLFGSRFLFQLIRLILLFPLLPPPVVDKASGATGSFEIFHLFRGGIHANSVRFDHPLKPFSMPSGSFVIRTIVS